MNRYIYLSEFSKEHEINSKRLKAEAFEFKQSLHELLSQLNSNDDENFISQKVYIDDIDLLHSDGSSECIVYLSKDMPKNKIISGIYSKISSLKIENNYSVSMIKLSNRILKKILNNEIIIDENIVFKYSSIYLGEDIKNLAFSTKARTLRFFNNLTSASIDPGLIATHKEWVDNPNEIIRKIKDKGWNKIISRSSSLNEDGFNESNAGAFESILNVKGNCGVEIKTAINKTFSSYDIFHESDEVFIQKQIESVLLSGVCTSRVIGKNSPYYVFSYDDTSGRTDSVTSGDTNDIKTLYVYRGAHLDELNIDENIKKLLKIIREIEYLVKGVALDIEFVISSDGVVNIVQIRPLVGDYDYRNDLEIDSYINCSKKLFERYDIRNDGINCGISSTVFGVMPDANPAELIGIKPRPLSFSLYEYLITDNIVTNQRFEYGYRDVRPLKHMVMIGGSPYINVKSSFNSFTPKNIKNDISEKLIKNYLEKLINHPILHDKVEFDIVATTWYPGVSNWVEDNYKGVLTHEEVFTVVENLKKIVKHAKNSIGIYHKQIDDYQYLFDKIINSDQTNLHKANILIDICCQYGCKPFAHLARSAFVSVSILKGLLKCGIITKIQYDDYLNSMVSVSSSMEEDAYLVKTGKLDKDVFNGKYGHLRPGTYDICNEAYFENEDKYITPIIASSRDSLSKRYEFSKDTISNIEDHFKKEEIDFSFSEFDKFSRSAISGREYGKFKYTKFLSYGLDFFIAWGKEIGLSRDDLSFLNIHDIHEFVSGTQIVSTNEIRKKILDRKTKYSIENKIELPDVISSVNDFSFFYKELDKPNFITGMSIFTNCYLLKSDGHVIKEEISGKIVLIESADPGFDWLFGCSISGLITKYGGANSHMAIRCAELGVPAAIGVGSEKFDVVKNWNKIRLDCIGETIKES